MPQAVGNATGRGLNKDQNYGQNFFWLFMLVGQAGWVSTSCQAHLSLGEALITDHTTLAA